jgi:hypothetical protein
VRIPLVGGAYEGISKNANAQTCINLYPQPDPTEPGEGLLVETPGHGTRFNVTASPPTEFVRGLIHPGGGSIGVVAGPSYHSLNPSGVLSAAKTGATINETYIPVSMASNGYNTGDDILIADSTQLLLSSSFGNLTLVANPTGGNFSSNTVTFMDGRFICDDTANRDKIYYSGYNDTTFVEFAFVTDFGDWDDVLGVSSVNRKLFVFGQHHVGVWYDTGTSTVFQRFQGGFSDTGCCAIYTAKPFDNSMVWLAGDEHGEGYVVRMGDNFVPQMISTPQINERIAQWEASIEKSFAFTMTWKGHEWYVLTNAEVNSNAGETFVYDSVSRQWFQWSSGSAGGRYMGNCHTFGMSSSKQFGGKHFIGNADATALEVFALGSTTPVYTEDGDEIVRERTTIHFAREEDRINIAELQLDMEEGTAPTKTEISSSWTVTTTEAKGATTIRSTDIDGTVEEGMQAAITMDNGVVHEATIITVNSGVSVVIGEPLPFAATATNTLAIYENTGVTLEVSKDGGKTFGNKRWRSVGVSGENAQRVIWRKLGWGRNWVFRFTFRNFNGAVRLKGLTAKLDGEPR